MSQSEMLQAALSEYERDEVHPEVLNILDPGNELLQDLVDGFGKTRSLPNKAHIACFFELQASNVGAIVGKQQKKVSILPRGRSASMFVAISGNNRLTGCTEVRGQRELGLS
jgi:hypothetical protein